MIDKSVSDIQVIRNQRYSIKSRDDTFRKFKGLIVGRSDDMYRWNDMDVTGGHLVGLGEGLEVRSLKTAIKLGKSSEVFDFLDVEETHDYIASGPVQGNVEVLNKNCQTGDQFINILDIKLNKELIVTFEELENMIEMDNLGLDYNNSKVINF